VPSGELKLYAVNKYVLLSRIPCNANLTQVALDELSYRCRATCPENHRRYVSEGVYGHDFAWQDAGLTSMGDGGRGLGSLGH
jgi:hypothetical protein